MKRGFTLIEVALSATLAALCIGFILSILPSSLFAIRHSEKRDYAGSWAQRLMEEHRNTPAAVLDLVWPNPKPMGQEAYQNTTFSAEFQVLPHAVGEEFRTIRATVRWKDRGDITKSVFRELIVCRTSR